MARKAKDAEEMKKARIDMAKKLVHQTYKQVQANSINFTTLHEIKLPP